MKRYQVVIDDLEKEEAEWLENFIKEESDEEVGLIPYALQDCTRIEEMPKDD